MTEQPQTPESTADAAGEAPADTPAPIEPTPGSTAYAGEPVMPSGPAEPPERPQPAAGSVGPADRPEIAVGAAFAGGFLFAMILRRLAR